MTQSTVEEQFNQIVDGIDKDEVEYEHGWWETSTGAGFGAKKKQELWELIQLAEQKAYQLGKEANAPYFHERKEIEQKAREEERERIVGIIEHYFKGLILIPNPELTRHKLINQITKE